MAEPLFRVRGLKVALPDMARKPLLGRAPPIEILKGLDFDLPARSVTGIVGESGSGKSTLGRALVRLIEPSDGAVLLESDEALSHVGFQWMRRHSATGRSGGHDRALLA